jgi:hypothetical protein
MKRETSKARTNTVVLENPLENQIEIPDPLQAEVHTRLPPEEPWYMGADCRIGNLGGLFTVSGN